jgi:hypothetical protein
MKISIRWAFAMVLLVAGRMVSAQENAVVQVHKPGLFRAGGPISFSVRLNEPLPTGARFDFRISPISADEEVPLGSGQTVDTSHQVFRVSGTLPEGALPGEWHISVIWLFLPGSGWTHNRIATNDLKFQVEAKPYAIPTKAEVSVAP